MTIKSRYNINQGAIKQTVKSVSKPLPWRQTGNQVSTVDFIEAFKKAKKGTAEKL
jgi:hypothetical protein